MTRRVSWLQTAVGLSMLGVGIGIFAFHALRHSGESGGFDVKAAIGIAAVGLLLLPFQFGNVRDAVRLWRERKSSTSGRDS